jgi:hypothetical protein
MHRGAPHESVVSCLYHPPQKAHTEWPGLMNSPLPKMTRSKSYRRRSLLRCVPSCAPISPTQRRGLGRWRLAVWPSGGGRSGRRFGGAELAGGWFLVMRWRC